jgi:flagellar hook-associated protein 3 FlgL
MIKGIDASAERYLADLNRIQDRLSRVEREISSGLRVVRPSDEPEQVMAILELRSSIERSTAVEGNLGRLRTEVDTSEAAVQIAVRIVERARVLAAEAATGTSINRAGSAIEAKQLHEQLVSLTRTVSEGRYVFSGDLDSQLLYEVDLTEPTGARRLATAANTRMIQDVNGAQFSAAKSAHEIFDVRNADDTPAAANVFAAVHGLTQALESDDQAAVEAAGANITAALEHLNRQLTFYGQAQNRVTTAYDLAKKAFLARTEELSQVQDADLSEALVNLTMASVHHQAALGARAQMPQKTLFDYLG